MNAFLTAPRPIRSVLIANRGEIACRVISTCRRLGLATVAVYSEADRNARHVRLADTAYELGPAKAADSYLAIPRIIAAAKATGADAIHPGYGFLSENAAFVAAIDAAGLIFIGPTADNVAQMGSKIEARRIAQAAGVPVVPGFDSPKATDAELTAAAAKIGYPVLVKASAGGGGRGMRRVMKPEELLPAVASARSEAASSFGDATIFLEKLVQKPRHVEVQIFGDGKGGALHFFERDCSVQRNHQKVIEEAPAPNLPESVRAALLGNAVKLAAQIRYAGAGTVEFVMSAEENAPYFLEMNTRLQVEHPVTEAICGVDLVEWQLRQAAGLPLPLRQDEIRAKGHAIELRVNAERPEAGFMPDTGRIRTLDVPHGTRFDTGVEPGDEISPHYDSMIAKLIVHRPDRGGAIAALVGALDNTMLSGVGNNLGFLRDCLIAPAFKDGRATTAFLTETFPNGWQPDTEVLLRLRGHAARAAIGGAGDPHRRVDGFRVGGRVAPGKVPLLVEDQFGRAELSLTLGREPRVASAGREITLGAAPLVKAAGRGVDAALHGITLTLHATPLADARVVAEVEGAGERILFAPLTGLVKEVHVKTGDKVAKGDTLVVMEAMKLIHTLIAPQDGVVGKLAAVAGQTVPAKTVLVELEEEK
ncbi:MAG: ATP-grasp domain-containing protein [Rhodospirillaceae bacterium]|nr:ATP-grasp domain-containing protein [Rhodospirillaceae bacterium]